MANQALVKVAFVCALCSSAALPLPARGARGDGAPAAGVSLKVLDAKAPPGGAFQFALTLTEPKPILTAWTAVSFGAVGPVLGAALFGPGGAASDVAGTAVPRDGEIYVSTTSPSADFGTAAGVPVLAMTIGLPADAPRGAKATLAVDPAASLWLDPAGAPYAQQVSNGRFTVAGSVSIADVSPGGGSLAPGSAVSVRGVGFQPGATVEIDGVPVSATVFVSDQEVVATILPAADLYGRRVRVTNPDLSRASYFSYLRAASLAPSARPLLAATMPIFSPRAFTSATFANAAAGGQFLAVALQNPSAGSADVTVELSSSTGAVLASAALTLPPRTRISREVTELFGGIAAPAGGFVVVRSTVPVQTLGIVGDDTAGTVVPLTPTRALP